MASILFLMGHCIYSTVKTRKEAKQKQRAGLLTDDPADSPSEKSTTTTTTTTTMAPHQQDRKDGGGQHETLREKAMRKIHSGDANNPSQLGDPISIKAETSSTVPTDDASGATTLRGSEDSGEGGGAKDGNSSGREGEDKTEGVDHGHRVTRREQAVGGNPSMLGDPSSMKAETEDRLLNAEEEEASMSAAKSKL